ncbi:MAG: hypothetical protein ACTSR4_05960 [Candidatus Hodarchaeales archaeon]
MTDNLHPTPFNKDFRWNAWKEIQPLVPEKAWVWQNVRTGEEQVKQAVQLGLSNKSTTICCIHFV